MTKSIFTNFKWLLVPLVLLTLGVGNAWGTDYTYTFTDKYWSESSGYWESDDDGDGFSSGIQVLGSASAEAHTCATFTGISKVMVYYHTNSKSGQGSIKVKVGSGSYSSKSVSKPSSGGTTSKSFTWTYSSGSGAIAVQATASANSVYVEKVVVTATGINTSGCASSGFSITYECDGADSGCPSNASDQTALPNPLPSAPVKTGFTFGGWYTNSIKTTAAVAGATLSGNITLYAKWSLSTCHTTTTIFYPIQGNMPSAGSYNYVGVYTADASTNVNNSSGSSLTEQTFTSCNGTQISFTHTSGSNYNTIWYASSSYSIRWYQNNPVTITAPTGYVVKSVSKYVGSSLTDIVTDNNTNSYTFSKSASGGEDIKYFVVVIDALACSAPTAPSNGSFF